MMGVCAGPLQNTEGGFSNYWYLHGLKVHRVSRATLQHEVARSCPTGSLSLAILVAWLSIS